MFGSCFQFCVSSFKNYSRISAKSWLITQHLHTHYMLMQWFLIHLVDQTPPTRKIIFAPLAALISLLRKHLRKYWCKFPEAQTRFASKVGIF